MAQPVIGHSSPSAEDPHRVVHTLGRMVGSIPLIDLGFGPNGEAPGPAHIDATIAEVDRACRDIGFFAVTNHPVADDQRAAILAAARAFFAMPNEIKQSVSIELSDHHRGYAGLEGELLQPGMRADYKETLDFGLERDADDPDLAPLEGPNQWPDPEIPTMAGFREVVEDYQDAAIGTARFILSLIARALDLPVDFFDTRLERPLVGTRLVHYPRVTEQIRDDQLGCGAHSDYGCITVLYTDGTPGLQLLERDGSWLDVEVPDGTFIINLGDMLERWTNDQYRSTKHRVISPTARARYSVPVFINPAYDTLVECLPSCVDAAHPPRYEPVTAGDYLQSRFDETFAYRDASDGESGR